MISACFPDISINVPKYSKDKALCNAQSTYSNCYRSIRVNHLDAIKDTSQKNLSDCYLVATLKALVKSTFGKKWLKESIKTSPEKNAFEVRFNKYTENNIYHIENNDNYYKMSRRKKFNPTGAVESATLQLVKDREDAKPLYLKIFGYKNPVEGNLASVFMETLTGKKPISIGDKSVLPLTVNKKKAVKLLDEIADTPDGKHSFVSGSKLLNCSDEVSSMHYYVIDKVNKAKKEIHLINPRYKDLTISYEEFLKNFRSIVGYFDSKIIKKRVK